MTSPLRAEPLEARDCPAAGSTLIPIGSTPEYTMSVNTYGRVAVMQMASPEWLNWQNGSATLAQARTMTQRIYQHFPDQYDFIFLHNNLDVAPPTAPYLGVNYGVKNVATGIGRAPFDDTALWGSQGRLQSFIHFISRNEMRLDAGLHEILHLSAAFLPQLQSRTPGHWGFSSVGGQLGGWAPGTLRTLAPGIYDADGPAGTDWFFDNAPYTNAVPYSPLELYLLGLIDASQVPDIQYATNPQWLSQLQGIFSASSIQTVTMNNIIAQEGLRTPGPLTSQKNFKVLNVVLTPNPITQAELDAFDTEAELFGRPGSDGDGSTYNFWEATRGLASLDMEGLDFFLPHRSPILGVGTEGGNLLGMHTTATTGYDPTSFASTDLARFLASAGESLRTAVGDVNGDHIDDFAVVTGPGGPTRFAVISGDLSRYIIPPSFPFRGSETFTGGAFVSVGDMDADGRADVVVSADRGGGPRVTIFSVKPISGPAVLTDFFGIADADFRGGARTAVGDVNKDGRPDLAVAAGSGGGPRISIYDGANLYTSRTRLLGDFFAFDNTLRDGAYLAIGDTNGDGFGDLIFGAGAGGAPRVLIASGQTLLSTGATAALRTPLANFFVAGDASSRGGVHVAAKNVDGDRRADLVVGSGEGQPGKIRVYRGATIGRGEPPVFQEFDVLGGAVLNEGVFVG